MPALTALAKMRDDAGDKAQALANYQQSLSHDSRQPYVASRISRIAAACTAHAERHGRHARPRRPGSAGCRDGHSHGRPRPVAAEIAPSQSTASDLASVDRLVARLRAQRPPSLRIDRIVDLVHRAVNEEEIGAVGMVAPKIIDVDDGAIGRVRRVVAAVAGVTEDQNRCTFRSVVVRASRLRRHDGAGDRSRPGRVGQAAAPLANEERIAGAVGDVGDPHAAVSIEHALVQGAALGIARCRQHIARIDCDLGVAEDAHIVAVGRPAPGCCRRGEGLLAVVRRAEKPG